ncbi:MAG: DctP family TRAP transporter solute-binding subunit [Planctomycetota bacterium]|jgi:tripartite ATP-independent transporter DctP family solute receptor|nr:DctP family TRAP transporter solute-binding subunit [Planctomycetota bacterium]
MRKLLLLTAALALAAFLAPSGEKVNIRFAIETSRTDSQYHGAQVFAKHVSDNTNGAVTIQLFPDSVLGGTDSQIGQVKSGTLDITLSGSGNFAGMIPSLNVFDVPFLFRDYDHVDKVMDGPIGRAIMDDAETQGFKGMSLWENGFRALTNRRNPARTPDDVKGLKIRVPGMPMHVECWRLLGANPVPMNYSEVFTALETGTIDAQDHPIPIAYSSRFYEAQKYLSVSNHAYTPLLLVMNLNRFKSFTPDQQKIIMEGAHLGALAQRKFARDNVDKYIEEIKDYGLEVIYAKEIDMKPWADKVMPGMIAFIEKIPEAIKYLEPIRNSK